MDERSAEGIENLFAKGICYEDSAKIPMILSLPPEHDKTSHHVVDDRLTELCDVMPTLLDSAGIDIPDTVEGSSLLGDQRRKYLYGEHYEDDKATRMIRDDQHKMIYYPVGNRVQLFDMQEDPDEMHDLADDAAHADICQRLTARLIQNMYGDDLQWVDGDRLVGLTDKQFEPQGAYGYAGQRGWRFI